MRPPYFTNVSNSLGLSGDVYLKGKQDEFFNVSDSVGDRKYEERVLRTMSRVPNATALLALATLGDAYNR